MSVPVVPGRELGEKRYCAQQMTFIMGSGPIVFDETKDKESYVIYSII